MTTSKSPSFVIVNIPCCVVFLDIAPEPSVIDEGTEILYVGSLTTIVKVPVPVVFPAVAVMLPEQVAAAWLAGIPLSVIVTVCDAPAARVNDVGFPVIVAPHI